MTTRLLFDHAATSPLRPGVGEAMLEAAPLGNPASLHASGRAARAALEDARERLADLLGCEPIEIVFTSGATESDRLALEGGRARPGRPHVLVTTTEHPAVAEVAVAVGAGHVGVGSDGTVDAEGWGRAAARLGDGLGVASALWVNNETGAVNDPSTLAGPVHEVGGWFHVDAAQALAHVSVDLADCPVDLVSLSAHKIGGPVGIGALVVRRALLGRGGLASVSPGGGQESGLRSGTAPVMLATGFAEALARHRAESAERARRHARLRERLRAGIGDLGVENADGVAGIVSIGFPGLRADDLLLLLDARGIDCSTGSACAAGVSRPSAVLLAMGRDPAVAAGSLRFSFGPTTTPDDVDRLLAALGECVPRARAAFG